MSAQNLTPAAAAICGDLTAALSSASEALGIWLVVEKIPLAMPGELLTVVAQYSKVAHD